MRLAALTLLVFGLCATSAVASAKSSSLLIENGRGTIAIEGKRVLVGRIEKGSLEIIDLTPNDQWSPYVNGVPRGKVTWIRGRKTAINFRVAGGATGSWRTARGSRSPPGAAASARSTASPIRSAMPAATPSATTSRSRSPTSPCGSRLAGPTPHRRPHEFKIQSMSQPQTILVVEDETSIASFVALYLKNAGYGVKAAATGEPALNASRRSLRR